MTSKPEGDDRTIARESALDANRARAAAFQAKLRLAERRLKLTSDQMKLLRLILRQKKQGSTLHWSNQHVRSAAGAALVDAFLDDFEVDPSRKRWLATFAWDEGITLERMPRVDIKALKGKVYKALREFGLEGLGVVEVDTTTNVTGTGKLLLFHIAVFCWQSSGLDFFPRRAAKKLMASRRFPNMLGAKSVTFKAVTLAASSVARIAAYFAKFPSCAKNRIPRRSAPGRYMLRPTLGGFAPRSALKLAEVMSYLDARTVFFSVGQAGTELRRRWHMRFMAAIRPRFSSSMTSLEQSALLSHSWKEIWSSN